MMSVTKASSSYEANSHSLGMSLSASVIVRSMEAPETPRRVPFQFRRENFRHIVDPICPAWPAAHEAEQPHPAARPKPMPRNRLIGIFRTGRQMAAGIADKAGKGQLIEAHKAGAEEAAGGFSERAGEVAGFSHISRRTVPECLAGRERVAQASTVRRPHISPTSDFVVSRV